MWDDDDQDSPSDDLGPAQGLPDPGTGVQNAWSWIVWTEPDEIEADEE